jgi:hypothetical protein
VLNKNTALQPRNSPIAAVQHLSKTFKNSIRTQCLSGKLKKPHYNRVNRQLQQYSISPKPSKPPSGLSALSGSVVNSNTALQPRNSPIAAVQHLTKTLKNSVAQW